MTPAARGEVWLADLSPTRDREQAGRRPVVVVSVDFFNEGPSGLVVVLPVTSTIRPIPSHVPIDPPEGGVKNRSAVLCEAVRSIASDRLVQRWGALTPASLERVEDCLRILLGL